MLILLIQNQRYVIINVIIMNLIVINIVLKRTNVMMNTNTNYKMIIVMYVLINVLMNNLIIFMNILIQFNVYKIVIKKFIFMFRNNFVKNIVQVIMLNQ